MPQDTQAQSFMNEQARAAMADPAFAAKASTLPPDQAAMDAAAAAIARARAALPKSKAAMAFEVLVVSGQAALLDSLHRAFGPKAVDALRSDPAALAKLPSRSQCALSAWIFPDKSFAVAAKAVDGSFQAMGEAIEASAAFREALGPGGDASMARARAAGWGADSASAIDSEALRRMISSLAANESQWLPGVAVSDRASGRGVAPQSLLESLNAEPMKSSLDEALANVFSEKMEPPAQEPSASSPAPQDPPKPPFRPQRAWDSSSS